MAKKKDGDLGRRAWTCWPWGATEIGARGGLLYLGRGCPNKTPSTVNFQWASGIQTSEPTALIPFPPTAAHQNLASKIFCLCCRHCEEPQSIDDSKTSSQTQEQQSAIHSRYQTRTACLASLDLIYSSPSC